MSSEQQIETKYKNKCLIKLESQKLHNDMTKGGQVKNCAIRNAKHAVLSGTTVLSHGTKSPSDFIEGKLDVVMNKFKVYIDKAKKTAHKIHDVIAPEKADYESSHDNLAKNMTALKLIKIHGYYAEAHAVVTEDGYILTIHRIPHPSNSKKTPNKTVLLHHGFLGSSIDWVIPGPSRSLPYILSEAGYDVWLANARGNTYSRAHIFRKVDSSAFWNFTFQDIAEYDLPAVIDYIEEHKTGNEKIDYIGYSMGTTVLFALLSTKTQYNNILRAGYTLAPVAFMKEIKSPFKTLAKYGTAIETFLKLVGANEFLPRNTVVRYLAKHSCKIEDVQEAICQHNPKHFDRSLMPIIIEHIPAGASTKTLTHFAQEIRNDGRFQKFDCGKYGNILKYGTATPPEYELNKITLPIWMISAEDDWLSSVADAKHIYEELVNPVQHYIVPDKDFNHLDFLFAKDARALVYDKILMMMMNDRPVFE